jgi:uncharacterized Zn finger protein
MQRPNMKCPWCGSHNVREHIVDWEDDDEEFSCGNCGKFGTRKQFTPKPQEKPEETKSEHE